MKINITDRRLTDVDPRMIGLFFEDINYGADGGLYAEMIENRSFEFFPTKVTPDVSPIDAWEAVGGAEFTAETASPINEINPGYAKIKGKKGAGCANSGYGGMYLEKGKAYDFSLYARGTAGLSVRVEGKDKSAMEFEIKPCAEWKKYEFEGICAETLYDARLFITLDGDGEADIDFVSLFPRDTFNMRKNGLRRDMAEALKNIRPGFLRFPGGCIVEGNGLLNRYRWKESVGDVEKRRCNWNRWQDGDVGVVEKNYFQSLGLGFYEYFLLCEDLSCEPLPVLNCGMGCQFQCDETADGEELDEYIRDALDLIEFANGDPDKNEWANLRREMGHKEPFGLKYLGIGNEQWGEKYFERYEKFQKVLAEKYPEIRLVTSSGPMPDGKRFDEAKAWLKGKGEDFAYLVDEHFYKSPEWMFENANRYDSYDRSGTKVFAGEYACHIGESGPKPNSLEAALAEAAVMTGFERNADVVKCAAYAPLFAREGHTQWTPDLIFVNNHEVLLTPSYHVQAMFSNNLPSYTLEIEREDDGDVFISAGFDEKSGEYILKLVNRGGKKDIVLTLPTEAEELTEITLTGNELGDINTFSEKEKVAPKSLTRKVGGREIMLTAQKYSFNVYKIR